MFDPTSRYANLPTAPITHTDAEGRTRVVVHVRRRFVPARDASVPLAEHIVSGGERLDLITARYLGDPTLFWRVCDANPILHPEELTAAAGQVIVIGMPKVEF